MKNHTFQNKPLLGFQLIAWMSGCKPEIAAQLPVRWPESKKDVLAALINAGNLPGSKNNRLGKEIHEARPDLLIPKYVVNHHISQVSPHSVIADLKKLNIYDGADITRWAKMDLWRFLDSNYFIQLNWTGISPETLLVMRLILGNKPYTYAVCDHIAKHLSAKSIGRELIEACHLDDDEFIALMKFLLGDDLNELIGFAQAIRDTFHLLEEAWLKLGYISLIEEEDSGSIHLGKVTGKVNIVKGNDNTVINE